jgi:hypothetical protein
MIARPVGQSALSPRVDRSTGCSRVHSQKPSCLTGVVERRQRYRISTPPHHPARRLSRGSTDPARCSSRFRSTLTISDPGLRRLPGVTGVPDSFTPGAVVGSGRSLRVAGDGEPACHGQRSVSVREGRARRWCRSRLDDKPTHAAALRLFMRSSSARSVRPRWPARSAVRAARKVFRPRRRTASRHAW